MPSRTNRKLSQVAAALATILTTAFSATPGIARASDNPLSNVSLPILNSVLGQSGQAQSFSKQDLPPFVTSADKVDAEIRIDVGKLAREMGGPVTLVHPKPLTNEYLCYNVTAVMDGKTVPEDTTSDKYGRPLYVVRGDENSGVFVIKIEGVTLNRTVGPDDVLQSPATLTPFERTMYTHMGQVPALQNAGWHAKVLELGLKKNSRGIEL